MPAYMPPKRGVIDDPLGSGAVWGNEPDCDFRHEPKAREFVREASYRRGVVQALAELSRWLERHPELDAVRVLDVATDEAQRFRTEWQSKRGPARMGTLLTDLAVRLDKRFKVTDRG